jgi:hypothetical protein
MAEGRNRSNSVRSRVIFLMTIGQFSLGDPSIAQLSVKDSGKKVPPKRTAQAVADQKLAPEPR